MGSSKLSEKPEESLRLQLVEKMISLGYPKELLSIEKQLDQLPHISSSFLPKRRIDILAYTERKGTFFPLLMIECKAVPFQKKHLQQLLGYNSFVQAPFIALANYDHFLWISDEKMYHYLPSFLELQNLKPKSLKNGESSRN